MNHVAKPKISHPIVSYYTIVNPIWDDVFIDPKSVDTWRWFIIYTVDGSAGVWLEDFCPHSRLDLGIFWSMLQVNITLPSGKSTSLAVPQSSKVGDVKILAQKAFHQGFLRLVSADGHVLTDTSELLTSVGIQDGDQLTAIACPAQIASNSAAFPWWCCGSDGIVTWGDLDSGG